MSPSKAANEAGYTVMRFVYRGSYQARTACLVCEWQSIDTTVDLGHIQGRAHVKATHPERVTAAL